MLRMVVWFASSMFTGILLAVFFANNEARVLEVSGTIATVVSLLLAVSLAISAVVATPFSVTKGHVTKNGAKRIGNVIAKDGNAILMSQSILFYLYLVTVILALSVVWNKPEIEAGMVSNLISVLCGGLGFFFGVSVVLSCRLPGLFSELLLMRQKLSD